MEEGRIVPKVWGEEQYITNTPAYCGKLLHVKAGFVCSDHRHLIKNETFYVLAGEGAIRLNGAVRSLRQGDTVHVRQETWHCFATMTGMTLLEISTHHDDADVERIMAAPSHKLQWYDDDDATLMHVCGAMEGFNVQSS